MQQATTSADPAENPEPNPAYAQLLQARFAALSEREQQILLRRALSDAPETLDVIGASLGVTRERIRQLEIRALDRLAGDHAHKTVRRRVSPVIAEQTTNESTDEPVNADRSVTEALNALRELPLPVTDTHLVVAGFAPLDSPGTRMLLAVARVKRTFGDLRVATAEFGGHRWLYTGDDGPVGLIAALIGGFTAGGFIDDLFELWDALEQRLQVHTGSPAEAADLAGDLVDDLGAVEVSGRYALLGGRLGVNEQVTRILRAHGGPMTADELMTHLPDRNRRTVENALVDKASPFVRVSRHEFNLKDAPGAVRHRTLREVVYDEIDDHGQVSVQHLQELAEAHGHSRASIAFYGWLPGLIEEGGVLRRRRPGDPPAVREPGLDDECFRVVAGAHRGRWSHLATVNSARLRGGSLELPAPLADLLGIPPGGTGVELKANGTHIVRGSWRHSPSLWSRDLKPVLGALGLAHGDRMRMIEAGRGELLIERVPELTGAGGPYRMLADGAGLYDEDGTQVAEGDIADALSFAIGLQHAPLVAVERRLRSRRNNDLADALTLLFPDQLAD